MRRLCLVLLALMALGCASAAPVTPPTDLTSAQALWAARDVQEYRFTIRRDCFCLDDAIGPFDVTVSAGISTVTRAGAAVDPALLEGLPVNAQALFAFAAERVSQEGFRARYDETTGFLLSVWSDPLPQAADDELGLTLSDLVIVK